MSKGYQISKLTRDILGAAAVLWLAVATAGGQIVAPQVPPVPQSPTPQTQPGKPNAESTKKSQAEPAKDAETHITPEEAKLLFGSS